MSVRRIPSRKRWTVYKRDNFSCGYCHRKFQPLTYEEFLNMPIEEKQVYLTIDHIVSVKNGGTKDKSNLRTSCKTCNLNKGHI